MGLLSHRPIRLLSWLRVKVSKSGITHSIGPKGKRSTIGVPGTGGSYLRWRSRRRMAERGSGWGALVTLAWAAFAVLVLFLLFEH